MTAEFRAEAITALEEADALLLGPRGEALAADDVASLFRAFHNVKAIAGFLHLDDAVALATAAETSLAGARAGTRAVTRELRDEVLAAAGAIRDLFDHAPVAAELPGARSDAGRQALVAGARVDCVKIETRRLDAMVDLASELAVLQAAASAAHRDDAREVVTKSLVAMAKVVRELQALTLAVRMVPLGGLFRTVGRMVHDTAAKTGKRISFEGEGDSTEIDRHLAEQIREPLLHIVRNAVDHGIESAVERRAAGKPETARIKLSARREESRVVIEIADDGRGLDRGRILAIARAKGIVGPTTSLSDAAIDELVFHPGFSTSNDVGELSGRGVGLDVVRRNVQALRGYVRIHSEPGVGTTFRVAVPLTLAIVEGTLASCGEETYILPSYAIVETFQRSTAAVATLPGGTSLLRLRGEVMPVLSVGRHLGACERDGEVIVVVDSASGRAAIVVDQIEAQRRVMLKPVPEVASTHGFGGAAVLPDGRVALVLDVDQLVGPLVDARIRQELTA